MQCLNTGRMAIVPAIFALSCIPAMAQVQAQDQSLTPQQKQTALLTFQSATLGVAAVDSLNPGLIPGTPGQDPLSQKWLQMSGILQASAKSGACLVQGSNDESFQVSGAACQVSYDDVSESSANGLSSSFSTEYSVVDPTYAAMTDVDSFQESGTISMIAGPNNSLNISMQGHGLFYSQQMGELVFSMGGSGNLDFQGNSKQQTVLAAQFPGFVAELEETSITVGNVTTTAYALNGIPLTQDEVNTYINPSFLPQDQSSSSSGRFFGFPTR